MSSPSKVWLITGSSRGLGRDLARAVLAAGDRLVATARTPDDLRDLVDAYGDRVRAVALDVTDPEAARAAVATAVSAFGRLDVLVNNAGYANVSPIEDVVLDDFRAQVETNFFGAINVTRAALPVMRAQGSGHILQISSVGGRTGTPGLAAYQASKWALEGFSEVLSREVDPLGIRVTIVEPGGMRTDWAGSSMRIDAISAPYEANVGAFREVLRSGGKDHQQSDPAKAAAAIVRIAGEKAPPLRLLLGSDAVFIARVVAASRDADDAKWRSLSMSTDADGMRDFAESPLAKMVVAQGQ